MKMLHSYWDHPNTTARNQPLADLLFFYYYFFLNTARCFRGILLIASSLLPSQCYIFLFYPCFQDTHFTLSSLSPHSRFQIPTWARHNHPGLSKERHCHKMLTQLFSIAASWHCCGHSSKGNTAERLELCQ